MEEQQDGEAFIKGPYVSVGLPCLTGSSGRDFFKSFETEHPPYVHQEQDWQRLASDRRAANTLVFCRWGWPGHQGYGAGSGDYRQGNPA